MSVTKPRVLVIDHHDSYVWNLVHLIANVTGELPDVVQHDADVVADGYTHVVLSPGPGHPDEYDWSVLDAGVPVLGVCLGMQAMVTHDGGQVTPIEPAHGVLARVTHQGDPLFNGIPPTFAAVRYHSLAAFLGSSTVTQRQQYSPMVRATAWSEDGVVMAVRHQTHPHVGVQFHPESILSEHGARVITNFLEMR